jgi:hypothetical protein
LSETEEIAPKLRRMGIGRRLRGALAELLERGIIFFLMLATSCSVFADAVALLLALGVVGAAQLANVVSRSLQSGVSDKIEPAGSSIDAVNETSGGSHGEVSYRRLDESHLAPVKGARLATQWPRIAAKRPVTGTFADIARS